MNTQQQLAEYRLWLAQTINQLNYDSRSSYDDMYIKGFEKALNKFREMFPTVQIADTQTLSDHLDKIPGMEIMDNRWPLGGIPDETDNIYPKH